MELKQIRNQANHAGEDDNRYSIDTVRKALKVYVELYEKNRKKIAIDIIFPPTAIDGTAGGFF